MEKETFDKFTNLFVKNVKGFIAPSQERLIKFAKEEGIEMDQAEKLYQAYHKMIRDIVSYRCE